MGGAKQRQDRPGSSASGSEVELGDGTLAVRLTALVVDALTVALHLAQVLVEDFARTQRRHQVVELAAVLLAVGFGLARFALTFPLLLQLERRRRRDDGGVDQNQVDRRFCPPAPQSGSVSTFRNLLSQNMWTQKVSNLLSHDL